MAAQDHFLYGPGEIYLGPVGTAEISRPSAEIDPNVWTILGTADAESYEESGITLTFNDTLFEQKVLGNTSTISARLTAQDLEVGVSLVDMRVETHEAATGVTGADSAATNTLTAMRRVSLKRPIRPVERALLLHFDESPYRDGGELQSHFYFPRVTLMTRGAISFVKSPAGMMPLAFRVMSHNGEIGFFAAETASATG